MTPKPENPWIHAKKHIVCNGPKGLFISIIKLFFCIILGPGRGKEIKIQGKTNRRSYGKNIEIDRRYT